MGFDIHSFWVSDVGKKNNNDLEKKKWSEDQQLQKANKGISYSSHKLKQIKESLLLGQNETATEQIS